MSKWQEAAALVTLTLGLLACAGKQEQQALLNQSAEQLLGKSREAYTILDRANLRKALAAKGVAALPQLSRAFRDEHWHVRHCALMAVKELAGNAGNRPAIKPLVPRLGQRVVQRPVAPGAGREHQPDGPVHHPRTVVSEESGRTFTARDVMLTLQYLFAARGAPEYVRSDNGPEFLAKEIQRWLDRASVGTLYIQKASPWENGDVESFNGKLPDELLTRELFLSLTEARDVLDEWRLEYNHRRPHSGIGWQAPAAHAARCQQQAAKWQAESAGVFPAARQAGPPVGPSGLPPAQPENHQPILSQNLV